MKEAILISVRPINGRYSELADALARMVGQVRSFDGCLTANLCLSDTQDEIVVFQVWRSRAAQEAYLTWRAEQDDFDAIHPLMKDEPTFQAYQLSE